MIGLRLSVQRDILVAIVQAWSLVQRDKNAKASKYSEKHLDTAYRACLVRAYISIFRVGAEVKKL